MTFGTTKPDYLKMRKKNLRDSTIILVGQEETEKIARYDLFGQLKFNVKCYINWMTARFRMDNNLPIFSLNISSVKTVGIFILKCLIYPCL